MAIYNDLDDKKYKEILREEEIEEKEFYNKKNHIKYDKYVDNYNKFNDIEYDDYEEEEIYNETNININFNTIYYWLIRIGLIIFIILMLYFIINLDIISIVLYLIILITSFCLGFIFMYFYSDKFKNI